MELPVILTTRTGKLVVIASVAAAAAAAVVLTAVLLGVLLTLPSDNAYLPQSGKHEMLVAQKDGAYRKNGQPVILARSYGGNPWEAVPDLDRQPVDIQCNDDNQCTMQTDVDYNVVSVVVPEELRNMTALHLAARLHQQATFGANLATLARVTEVYGTNYGNWIRDQMRLTPTLLRSYYRDRANARPGMFDVGQKTAPCDMGSRWHRYMITSNPSPRYMKEVVRAFRTGAYRGVEFSGRYGDLAATIYAILMDHEARSPIVEADPTFGMYRDPLVKLLHLMRSLDYQSPKQREVAFADLDDRLGVQPFSAPSVFGFYLPEFRPAGPADEHGLVGPQLQLATTPNLIGFLNGLTSLIDHGLTSCENGLGVYGPSRRCVATGPHPTADGSLTYTMPINGTVNDLVDELSLALTAGRLHRSTRETLVREYLSVLGPNVTVNTTAAALRHALKVLVTSAEFQTTSFNSISNKPRLEPAPVASSGRAFKAIVVVFEMGGADSFNKLVPHSDCTGKDLYAEYATVRAGAALDKTLLRPVSVPAGQQPCTVFGVHPAMSNLSKLYSDGDALTERGP
ncbi:uncharacterized protein ACA1_003000 [Acanthamoeba castellanii str. Neff]|uniref:Uncharacterized protein n=1 Tax=Acanthamoeba castellanii (strain ATCC 30010 / Neff) TaxID=1257118 RepID=L8GSJ5_ACACF|nr:uncharacterized protein ACA1_003000 [Acanthamoeba castellanii str. Neff]ELR15975.1 hypothetical protein ACA1_003000 [Acanthamoeba castellanii str. Neff]